MPILPSIIQKILSEETDVESPVSEATFQKIGSTINGLVDLNGFQVFLANGIWTVPSNVRRAIVFGAGGGGSGATGSLTGNSGGGSGGQGCVPYAQFLFGLNDFETYTVTIGAGGVSTKVPNSNTSAEGNPGGNTIISGPADTITYYGGLGGTRNIGGGANSTGKLSYAQGQGRLASSAQNLYDPGRWRTNLPYTMPGGYIGDNFGTPLKGQDSPFAVGGNPGNAGAGGTGGGAGLGPGGNGGVFVYGPNAAGPGTSAAPNSCAGGGGGTATSIVGTPPNGGDGGSGFLIVIW
jgi:hypothetical protein